MTSDITHIPTWAGFIYLPVVLDAWSRRIVGRSMGHDLETQLVIDAMNMAIGEATTPCARGFPPRSSAN